MVFYLCTSSLYGSNSNGVGSVHHSKDDLKSWSYNDIAIFFTRQGHESISEVITENNIDGSNLLLLLQEDIHEIFPHSIGHRAV